MSDFAITISNLLKARFALLYISTWEEERVISIIQKICSDRKVIKTPRKVAGWTINSGVESSGFGAVPGVKFEETKNPLQALEFIEHCQEPAVFLLKDFHVFFGWQGRSPDFQVIRKIRDLIPKIILSPIPKNVIFISPAVVLPHELQKDVTIIDFDLPSLPEIRSVLRAIVEANRSARRINFELSNDDEQRLVQAALGLTLREAENAFALAMVQDGCLSSKDVEVILEEKRQIIKKSEILEFINSDSSIVDIGGLENLKRWLKKRDKSWLDSAKNYCLPAPKGVLLTGVPGCGKSLTAKAVAAMWQMPLLRLDLGKIFSGIVGSSEDNMRRAIKTAEAIAPCVLWIDEIEKGFSGTGASGDSGTSTRIFGTFLTWMQEKTKPVFVVATANNINLLPAELLRKGRFDEIFFVDLPTQKERVDIFQLHLNKRLRHPSVIGDFAVTEPVLTQLADMTEGFVGAEIEQIVFSALFEAFSEERSIKLDDFVKSIKNLVPLSVTQSEQIKYIRQWANVRAVSATSQEYRNEYLEARESEADVDTSRGGRTIDF